MCDRVPMYIAGCIEYVIVADSDGRAVCAEHRPQWRGATRYERTPPRRAAWELMEPRYRDEHYSILEQLSSRKLGHAVFIILATGCNTSPGFKLLRQTPLFPATHRAYTHTGKSPLFPHNKGQYLITVEYYPRCSSPMRISSKLLA
ncbi:unnamed protein product [Colias eurytheme]|nr:unnamed protein product [Colias eurytheme]